MTGLRADGVVITGERRLAAVALAERLAQLGIDAEVRPPARLDGTVPARRAVAVLAANWSLALAELVRRCHGRGHHVFVLPPEGGKIDRIQAMRHGATDIIPAGPQQGDELALKLRRLWAAARPQATAPGGRYRVGSYAFDPVRQQLAGTSGTIELTPTQSVILYCLLGAAAADPARRLRVPDLISACHLPGMTPAALRKHVFELRAKLEHVAGLQVITGDLRMGLACDHRLIGAAE